MKIKNVIAVSGLFVGLTMISASCYVETVADQHNEETDEADQAIGAENDFCFARHHTCNIGEVCKKAPKACSTYFCCKANESVCCDAGPVCKDLKNDRHNCGACGNDCGVFTCSGGGCSG